MESVTLFDPSERPFRGLRSAVSPLALRPGEWQAADNVRVSNELLTCRYGMSASLSTILASSEYRGHWSGKLGADSVVLVAVRISSETRVYWTQDLTTWAELTAASGKYGNTRFTTDAQVTFEAVPQAFTPTAVNTVIWQNGTDRPRCAVYDSNANSWGVVEVIAPIDAPKSVIGEPVRLKHAGYFPVGNASTTTHTSSGGGLGGADATLSGGAANTDNVCRFTLTTASLAANDTATVQFSAAMTVSVAPNWEVHVGLNTAITNFWDYFKLEIGSGSGWFVIHDPTSADYPRPEYVPVDNEGRALCVFDLSSRNGVNAAIASGTYDRFRLTYLPPTSAAAPTGNPVADIFLFAVGGRVPAGALWGITHAISVRCESAPALLGAPQMPLCRESGGPILGGLRLPATNTLRMVADIPYRYPSTTDRDRGVAAAFLYAQYPGDDLYRYMTSETLANYSAGSWSFVAVETDPYLRYSTYNGQEPQTSAAVQMPDDFHIPVPVSRGMRFANGRLFAGSNDSSLASGLAFSRYQNAFRFRYFVDITGDGFENSSPGMTPIMGEPIRAIAAVSGSSAATIYAFSESAVYACSGITAQQLSRVARISDFGTISPYTVVGYKGTVFYLDTEMQVRFLSPGSMSDVTRGVVDNWTKAIPASRREYASAAIYEERYYLSFTPSGGTQNTRALVMEIADRRWVTDTPPKPMQGIMSRFNPSTNAWELLACGQDGSDLKLYRYDSSAVTQDLGTTNITVTLTSPEYLSGETKIAAGPAVARTDDVSGGTMTVTRTYQPGGNTATSTLSLDASSGAIWRRDSATPPTLSPVDAEGSGATATVSYAASMTGGKNIYHLSVKMGRRAKGYDA